MAADTAGPSTKSECSHPSVGSRRSKPAFCRSSRVSLGRCGRLANRLHPPKPSSCDWFPWNVRYGSPPLVVGALARRSESRTSRNCTPPTRRHRLSSESQSGRKWRQIGFEASLKRESDGRRWPWCGSRFPSCGYRLDSSARALRPRVVHQAGGCPLRFRCLAGSASRGARRRDGFFPGWPNPRVSSVKLALPRSEGRQRNCLAGLSESAWHETP